ncbi:Rieske 2Fe-2S domain-containing protein [Mangrovicoccus sp. HB161399]|uniref:Rieske (2Fe-2S) protein n=1 Tax=Mangrovicoccus sp. HB161399 TaxID=2720392 RepID=UPI0015530139|nr:Rieske 2Fe-2S domain-containing protein [Mangrovicoccus sp. HB161399]
MPWTDYSSAPPAGTQVCALADLDRVQALTVDSAAGQFPLLLVRDGAGLRAFVNACPHQYLPLDYQGGNILSADGTRLMCTAHGAMFDAVTGAADLVAPCGLDPVPLQLEDGMVLIGG